MFASALSRAPNWKQLSCLYCACTIDWWQLPFRVYVGFFFMPNYFCCRAGDLRKPCEQMLDNLKLGIIGWWEELRRQESVWSQKTTFHKIHPFTLNIVHVWEGLWLLSFIFISFVITINAAISTTLSHGIFKLLSGTSSSFPGSNKVFYALNVALWY